MTNVKSAKYGDERVCCAIGMKCSENVRENVEQDGAARAPVPAEEGLPDEHLRYLARRRHRRAPTLLRRG